MGTVPYGFVELLAGHSLLIPEDFPASQIKIPANFANDRLKWLICRTIRRS
jgi:hypothetical protein